LSKNVQPRQAWYIRFSTLSDAEQEEVLRACRALTDSIFEGLDGMAARWMRSRSAIAAKEPKPAPTANASAQA